MKNILELMESLEEVKIPNGLGIRYKFKNNDDYLYAQTRYHKLLRAINEVDDTSIFTEISYISYGGRQYVSLYTESRYKYSSCLTDIMNNRNSSQIQLKTDRGDVYKTIGTPQKIKLLKTLLRKSCTHYDIEFIIHFIIELRDDLNLDVKDVVEIIYSLIVLTFINDSHSSYTTGNRLETHLISFLTRYVFNEPRTNKDNIIFLFFNNFYYSIMDTAPSKFNDILKAIYKGSNPLTIYLNHLTPLEAMTDDNIDFILEKLEKVYSIRSAKSHMHNFLHSLYICSSTKSEEIVDFILERFTDSQIVNVTKKHREFSNNTRMVERVNKINGDSKSEIERGSVEYYKILSTKASLISSSTKPLAEVFDTLDLVKPGTLSEKQLYLLEKMYNIRKSRSETVYSKEQGFTKLVSTTPRIINLLITFTNSLTDKQYEQCQTLIDVIINKYCACSEFFGEVGNIMTDCKDTRLIRDILFIIEHKQKDIVRNNFLKKYIEEPAFSWVLVNFLNFDEGILLDKKVYPKLCKSFLKAFL